MPDLLVRPREFVMQRDAPRPERRSHTPEKGGIAPGREDAKDHEPGRESPDNVAHRPHGKRAAAGGQMAARCGSGELIRGLTSPAHAPVVS